MLASICLVLATTVTACHLVAPTPDPAEIERLVAEAVQATIAAMPTATPYPTYTPAPLAPTYTPRPTHTGTVVPSTSGSQAGSAFLTHIVVAGDTLSGLAKEYDTTVEAIMEANELSDAGLIIVGQVLSIPVEEAGPASTPTTPISPTLTATSVPPTATPTETPAP